MPPCSRMLIRVALALCCPDIAHASPDEAYRRFDELAKRHVENLRRLTQQIQFSLPAPVRLVCSSPLPGPYLILPGCWAIEAMHALHASEPRSLAQSAHSAQELA
eukprot:1160777-Pelagomonas_calceolata.AAC.15